MTSKRYSVLTGYNEERCQFEKWHRHHNEAVDETLREAIVSHVSMMVTRLQEGRNPEVIIQCHIGRSFRPL